jgi:hypothetical protein
MQLGRAQLLEWNLIFLHVVNHDFKIKMKPTMSGKALELKGENYNIWQFQSPII